MTNCKRIQLRGNTGLTPIQRFVRFIPPVQGREDECWLWGGSVNQHGYGRFWDGKNVEPHRWLFQQFHPTPLRGRRELVCHTCDTPTCVNPNHLFLGNASVNLIDCVSKGRHPKALRTHCKHEHKFTPENTRLVLQSNGRKSRRCKTCDGIWHREYARLKLLEKVSP